MKTVEIKNVTMDSSKLNGFLEAVEVATSMDTAMEQWKNIVHESNETFLARVMEAIVIN